MNHVDQIKEMIKKLVISVEDGRKVHHPDCVGAYAPTEELFLTFTSGGLKREGESIGVWCTSPQLAINLLAKHLISYKYKTNGIVYWRGRPTVNIENFLKPVQVSQLTVHKEATVTIYPLYFAWCRILISDKSPIKEKLDDASKQDRGTPQPDEGFGDGKLEGN